MTQHIPYELNIWNHLNLHMGAEFNLKKKKKRSIVLMACKPLDANYLNIYAFRECA